MIKQILIKKLPVFSMVLSLILLSFSSCTKETNSEQNNNQSVTYLIKMKGGGGYESETILKFNCSDKPLQVQGQGYSDDNDNNVRVGISNTPDNFTDFSGNSWNTLSGLNSTFYVLLNSKWGEDNDTYAELKVTLPENGTITYTKYDTHSNNLDYVTITEE